VQHEEGQQMRRQHRGLSAQVSQVRGQVTGRLDRLDEEVARESTAQSEVASGMMGPGQPRAASAAAPSSHQDGRHADPRSTSHGAAVDLDRSR
jgi:hypothetical protein